ncbi:hypothetical protein CLOM_g4212 [Closterium sp. NIES-68]|nr:hypothetical protein CLOM_g4212 [Closterium sp. NIES-68]
MSSPTLPTIPLMGSPANSSNSQEDLSDGSSSEGAFLELSLGGRTRGGGGEEGREVGEEREENRVIEESEARMRMLTGRIERAGDAFYSKKRQREAGASSSALASAAASTTAAATTAVATLATAASPLHASQLRSLCLDWCLQITDDAFEPLSACHHLASLSARGCNRLSAAALTHIAHLPCLAHLNLEMCGLLKGGMRHLTGLSTLLSLNVGWCTSLDDEDMAAIARLSSLRSLNVSRCKITDTGLTALLRALSSLTLSAWQAASTSQMRPSLSSPISMG